MSRFTRTAPAPTDNGNGGDPVSPEGEKGRPETSHGAYQAVRIFKERELDLRRRDHRIIQEWKAAVIGDLGGSETVDTFQLAMIDRAVELLIILNAMASHVEATGIMKGDDLAPCLRQSFISYQNSFRITLATAYGYTRDQKGKKPKKPLDLEDYLKSKEERKNDGENFSNEG